MAKNKINRKDKEILNDEEFWNFVNNCFEDGDWNSEERAIMVFGSLNKAIKNYRLFKKDNEE